MARQFVIKRTDEYYIDFDENFLQLVSDRLERDYDDEWNERYADLDYIAKVLEDASNAVIPKDYYVIKDCACETTFDAGFAAYGDEETEIQIWDD